MGRRLSDPALFGIRCAPVGMEDVGGEHGSSYQIAVGMRLGGRLSRALPASMRYDLASEGPCDERPDLRNRVRQCAVLPEPAAIPVPAGAAEGGRGNEEARSPELS